jgi:hypothetical protein
MCAHVSCPWQMRRGPVKVLSYINPASYRCQACASYRRKAAPPRPSQTIIARLHIPLLPSPRRLVLLGLRRPRSQGCITQYCQAVAGQHRQVKTFYLQPLSSIFNIHLQPPTLQVYISNPHFHPPFLLTTLTISLAGTAMQQYSDAAMQRYSNTAIQPRRLDESIWQRHKVLAQTGRQAGVL